MLGTVLSFLGVDLQQQANQVQARAEVFRDRTLDKTAWYVRHTSLIIGFAAMGAVMGMVTLAIALTALYRWVEINYGDMPALAATGVATAVIAGLMLMIALAVNNRRPAPTPMPVFATPAAPPAPRPTAAAAASHLSSLLPPLPAGSSLLDIVAYKVTSKAAAASEEAVEGASEFVRTGSRGALLGTLAATVLIGVLIGRRTPDL
jgi:hypothetical protein